jgi:AcrR family transcriptional regulator
MPKIIDFDEKRREISAQAVSVLAEEGLQASNLGKVAERCGVGRTTLYEYFPNMGKLVDFCLAETFEQLSTETLALREDRRLSATERLLKLMEFLEGYASQNKDRMILMLDFLLHPRRETPGVSFDVPSRVRIIRSELERVLTEAVDSGEIRHVEPASMAFTLFSFVEAASIHGALYDNLSLQSTLRDIKILIQGLRL